MARARPPEPAPAARIEERPAETRQVAAASAAIAPAIRAATLPGGMAESCPPDYPRAAIRDGIQGRVVLRVRVSAEGHAMGANVVVSSGSDLLDRAALAALNACRFTPAEQDGRAVASDYEVPYRFRLSD